MGEFSFDDRLLWWLRCASCRGGGVRAHLFSASGPGAYVRSPVACEEVPEQVSHSRVVPTIAMACPGLRGSTDTTTLSGRMSRLR
jgi:hypothetical protein